MIASFCVYVVALFKQYNLLKESTSRLQILSIRAAICVPCYAFFIFLSLAAPSVYQELQIPIAILEGYSFYCFFLLLITNMGGLDKTLNYLIENDKPLCFTFCCPTNKISFYGRVKWALINFLTTRFIVVVFSVIFEPNRIVAVLLDVIAVAFTINAVLSLVTFYENVYTLNENIKGVSKLFVIKVSVGIIVFQGLIVQIVIALNQVTLHANSQFTQEEMAIRLYCKIIFKDILQSLLYYFNS